MSVSRAQVLAHAQAAIDWLRERVTGQLHSHSARIHAGDGFIAWPGAAVDARQYVPAALAAGASACLVDAQGWEAFAFNDERVCALHDLKKHAGAIAAAVYNNPGQRIQTLAITGTNGKTSVSWWLSQALHHLGMRCAIVGTLGVGEPQWRHDCVAELEATGLTTPDPIQLQTALCTWDRAGVRACALEASSIGIVDHRLVGFPVHTAIFTNFTQDHLDYHGTMDNYWQAKRQLFDKPDLRYAIINTDDEKGRELVADLQNQRPDVSIWTYGLEALPNSILSASQHIRATELEIQSEGMRFMVGHGLAASASEWVQTELMGRYNVSNLLAVIASLTAWGYSLSEAAESAQLLRPVPGRLERVPGPDKKAPTVLVDYAHTPDALAQVLQTLQSAVEVRSGRLWGVAVTVTLASAL